MYRWILIFLMIPAIALAQVEKEAVGGGGADADTIKGVPVQDTTGNLADNDIIKYNLANNQWEYEIDSGAGGGSIDIVWIHDDADDDSTSSEGSEIHLKFGVGIDAPLVGDTITVVVDETEFNAMYNNGDTVSGLYDFASAVFDKVAVGSDTVATSAELLIQSANPVIQIRTETAGGDASLNIYSGDTTGSADQTNSIIRFGKYDAAPAQWILMRRWDNSPAIDDFEILKGNDVMFELWADSAFILKPLYLGVVTPDSIAATLRFTRLEIEDSLNEYSLTSAIAAGYQPLEATLTDIADGTIVENLVNTDNPWADDEVVNAITVDPINATTETAIEAVVDLQSLQGAVTDGQVPDSIAIKLADDQVLKQKFGNEDWGDVTVLSNSITLDTDVVGDNEIDYANVTLADFDYQTAWSLFYSDASGDVTELDLSTQNGEFLRSNGSAPPTFEPGGAGETNILADTGTFNGVSGFGFTQTKAGVELRIRGIIEGSNITITKAGTGINDTALVITASGGSGVWAEGTDSLFAIDSDGDTVAVFWDDDAGNVRWQVATEDQTLRILLDTLGLGGDVISEFAGTGLTVTSNELTVDLGTTIDTLEIVDAQWQEYISDWAGAMLGGTETGISVTYEDATNDIDFVVDVDSNSIADAGVSMSKDLRGFSSADLLGKLSDETGSGLAVFSIAPTFTGKITADSITVDSLGVNELNLNGDFVTDIDGGDLQIDGGVLNVTDDSHNHVITNIDAFTKANLETQTSDVADYAEADGDTWTGVHNFGGATSFEIPNGATPTTDAEGEIAWDDNDNAIEVWNSEEGESVLIPSYKVISIPIVLPDSIAVYSADLFIYQVNELVYPAGIEIDSVIIQLDADAAYSMVFEEWSGADPPVFETIMSTVTTGAADTRAAEAPDTDGNLDAGDWIVLDIPATDVDVITCIIVFHVTEG